MTRCLWPALHIHVCPSLLPHGPHSIASRHCALEQSKGKHTSAQPATQTRHLRPAAPLRRALQVAQAVTAIFKRAMSTAESARSCCWPSWTRATCVLGGCRAMPARHGASSGSSLRACRAQSRPAWPLRAPSACARSAPWSRADRSRGRCVYTIGSDLALSRHCKG